MATGQALLPLRRPALLVVNGSNCGCVRRGQGVRRRREQVRELHQTVGVGCTTAASDTAKSDAPLDSQTPFTSGGVSKAASLIFCASCIGQALGYVSVLPASLLLASAICLRSWIKQSLSTSGVVAAWSVFALTHYCSYIVSALLLAFFLSSSRWTTFKAKIKDNYTVENKKGGRRNWVQVLCNGGLPTLFALLYAQSVAFQQAGLPATAGVTGLGAFFFGCCLGAYACCCGDTWASEIGVLSKSEPRLITTLKSVPRGTNGGVSLLGLAASTLGGLFIGMTAYAMSVIPLSPWIHPKVLVEYLPLILLGTLGGLLGSIVDSLLGATLQYSGFDETLQKVVNRPGNEAESSISRITGIDILSNNQVNLVSSFMMALCIGGLTHLFFV